jgi:membrane protein implicated in regulation of membrane protease activity
MLRYVKYVNGEPRVVTVPRWAIALGVLAALLVGFLVLILAAGVALVVIPLALIAAAIAAWFGRGRRVKPQRERDPDIVDAEFRVIDRSERERDPRRDADRH